MFPFSSSVSFTAQKDLPSLEGKVILVTGGNHGLGKQSILEFARKKPAQIWMTSRDVAKGQAAIDDIKKEVPDAPIQIIQLDVASFESVKKASETILAKLDRLDILMLNAGIMAVPPGLTKDGYEIQFGTNHMGHHLLTRLILPLLQKTAAASGPKADVRVVVMSSIGHRNVVADGFRWELLRTKAEGIGAYERYGMSKLANALFARQLARDHPELRVVAVHPGFVNTGLLTNATDGPYIVRIIGAIIETFVPGLLSTTEQGTQNQLWASVSKDVKSGEYYEPIGVHGRASSNALDDALAKKLWDWTEKELAEHGYGA
ncbi:short-chain dehydrogenase/reductase [Whalleya microplaca]|nr:short-chain dehydrogenase/reductase [Whalleya microplaca]